LENPELSHELQWTLSHRFIIVNAYVNAYSLGLGHLTSCCNIRGCNRAQKDFRRGKPYPLSATAGFRSIVLGAAANEKVVVNRVAVGETRSPQHSIPWRVWSDAICACGLNWYVTDNTTSQHTYTDWSGNSTLSWSCLIKYFVAIHG